MESCQLSLSIEFPYWTHQGTFFSSYWWAYGSWHMETLRMQWLKVVQSVSRMHFFKAHLRTCCKIESVLVNDMSDLQRLVGSSHQPLDKKGRHHFVKSRVPYFNCKRGHVTASKIDRKKVHLSVSQHNTYLHQSSGCWLVGHEPKAVATMGCWNHIPPKPRPLGWLGRNQYSSHHILNLSEIAGFWNSQRISHPDADFLGNQPTNSPNISAKFQALKVVQFHHPS